MHLLQNIFLIFILSTFLEFVTVFMRIVWRLRSKKLQERIHLPRTHHSYIGAIMLLFSLFRPSDFVFITGLALIFSDLAHHLIILPLLKKYNRDINMSNYQRLEHHLAEISVFIVLLFILLALIPLKIEVSWR